ncbi:MAG: polyribonucleotide nucleotidyltransferase [Acidimicrobiales bacterium]|jgi:polyribonucleotide nucleotidyltransferase
MQKKTFEVEIGGKILTAEFTDLTNQANGSVILRLGETAILVTAVMSSRTSNMPYFPLSVEFEEKFYAAGKILGSRFMRREGRPSDEAVLSARIIDRTIRPLFDQSMRNDIQVVVTVLALGEDDPDVLGVIGASLALSVSDIPWAGPVGAVRIVQHAKTGEVIINPTYKQREGREITQEVLTCGKDGNINMVETAAFETSEEDILALFEASVAVHQKLEVFQKEIVSEIGVEKKVYTPPQLSDAVHTLFTNEFKSQLTSVLFSDRAGKDHIHELKDSFIDKVKELEEEVNTAHAEAFFEDEVDTELHRGALEDGKRADGRSMDAVRELYAQAGAVSPVLHGSGIFYRGGTHIFTALTLAGPESAQLVDTIEFQDTKKRYIHHYNFAPFSVGESGRVGGFNRRMIGHGSLAEKALIPVIPTQSEFPYTIRLVSETMASNGSSSMGSACASTLALMDGGVPIKRPVAGIASGLMMQDAEHYALLTDIQGPEDEHGDMDFKVAGTREGVTAIQMDVKVEGIPVKILGEALEKAKLARLQILDVMEAEIAQARENISPRAPEIVTLTILPDQIGLVIGGGGKTINAIKESTGVEEISIEDDGSVFITGKNGTAHIAAEKIALLTKVYEVGEKMKATITRVVDFGAFAKIDDQNEGLIHISEIAPFRIEKMDGILTEGEVVDVVISKVDDGKIGLSIKQIDPEFAQKKGITAPERP